MGYELNKYIHITDKEVDDIIHKEYARQFNAIELIPSENFVSDAVLAAMGSCLQNKYAEGYPSDRTSGREGRYYGGCQYIDELEELCCNRWRKVFHTDYHVNVQPHSGSQANAAVYMALLDMADYILMPSWDLGAHLTHGSQVNFSGKLFNVVTYNADENGRIDYYDIEKKLKEYQPRLILAGASAYSRFIDFEKIYNIINKVRDEFYYNNGFLYKPYFMVDMAHIAGLVAAGRHPSPFGYADVITTTTHKTLRGPRGGMIFCRPELAKKIDGGLFPGTQGGPLEHVIAAKAVCAKEALHPTYKEYIDQVLKNTKAMADEFKKLGYEIVTGGTDNHLFLIDFTNTHPYLTGLDVQERLDKYDITVNKNIVPGDKRTPKYTSGIRLGCAAMTTKGWKEQDAINCVYTIHNHIERMKEENDQRS